jgi:glycosyltransferase involved in cell wall biosynthesis
VPRHLSGFDVRETSVDLRIREQFVTARASSNYLGRVDSMARIDVGAPSVAIILSTFEGARFLDGQLASLERQTHKNWFLLAADDHSTDESLAKLRKFQDKHGTDRVTIKTGPGRGFVANFLSLICQPDLRADYYAFSDQDDVWEANKLARALAWHSTVSSEIPAVYGSRTTLINPEGRKIGVSPLFRKPPTFCNALVQNIAGGNTMVLNEAARQLLIKAGGVVDVPSHDWWLYLLTTASGGLVHYDPYCSVRYRRHERNLVGWNIGVVARVQRAKMLIEGRFKRWTDQNIEALDSFRPHMSAASRATFDAFCDARRQRLVARIRGVRRAGVYRQTVLGSIGLVVGIILNKI